MRRSSLLIVPLALALLSGVARAEDATIGLTAPAAIAGDVDAFPKLVAHDAIANKINAALVKLDGRVRKARAECLTAKNADWSRSIEVTMRGPRYLSYVVRDATFCGGANPNASGFALVYDLSSGVPVDWSRLLPKPLVERTALDTSADGAAIGVVGSKALTALYLAGLDKDLDPSCDQVLRETDLNFLLWPDAEKKGLAIETISLPHVVQACTDVVVIGLPKLRELGAAASLIEGLEGR